MQKNPNSPPCPLCGSNKTEPYHEDRLRPYFQCGVCQLVFVPPSHYLAPDAEKSCYDFHQNDPNDTGYRQFLNRICAPMLSKLKPGMRGLDFGCGPGPALSLMFKEAGYPCRIYDPFYANEPEVLKENYDFLSCTEAIEHFHRPRAEFERFLKLVKPGGWIGIMTQLVKNREAFRSWHYTADETHVCYYSEETFRWLAACYGLHVEFPAASVILFQTQIHPVVFDAR